MGRHIIGKIDICKIRSIKGAVFFQHLIVFCYITAQDLRERIVNILEEER